MTQDLLTWGALILAGGSIITVVKFWIDIGRTQQRAEDASETARIANAQYNLLTQHLNEFKVDAARTYATIKALNETEAQLIRGFENAVQGIFTRLDGLNTRIDTLINITKQPS